MFDGNHTIREINIRNWAMSDSGPCFYINTRIFVVNKIGVSHDRFFTNQISHASGSCLLLAVSIICYVLFSTAYTPAHVDTVNVYNSAHTYACERVRRAVKGEAMLTQDFDIF